MLQLDELMHGSMCYCLFNAQYRATIQAWQRVLYCNGVCACVYLEDKDSSRCVHKTYKEIQFIKALKIKIVCAIAHTSVKKNDCPLMSLSSQ